MLMRAPRECASWFWNLDGEVEPGLESALRTAGRTSAILQKHALLEPDALEWNWFQAGKGGLGIHSRLNLVGCSLEDQALPDGLRSCRPNGHPLAEMGGILVLGSGTWFDASGTRHSATSANTSKLVLHPLPRLAEQVSRGSVESSTGQWRSVGDECLNLVSRLGVQCVPLGLVSCSRHVPRALIGPLGSEDHFLVVSEQFDPIEHLPCHRSEAVCFITCRDEDFSVRVLLLAVPAVRLAMAVVLHCRGERTVRGYALLPERF